MDIIKKEVRPKGENKIVKMSECERIENILCFHAVTYDDNIVYILCTLNIYD